MIQETKGLLFFYHPAVYSYHYLFIERCLISIQSVHHSFLFQLTTLLHNKKCVVPFFVCRSLKVSKRPHTASYTLRGISMFCRVVCKTQSSCDVRALCHRFKLGISIYANNNTHESHNNIGRAKRVINRLRQSRGVEVLLQDDSGAISENCFNVLRIRSRSVVHKNFLFSNPFRIQKLFFYPF